MSMKESKPKAYHSISSQIEEWPEIKGKDELFGLPQKEYNYRCSQCNCEMLVNEVIIDAEIGIAEFEGRWYEGIMPVLGYPGCNVMGRQWNMQTAKSPPEWR